MELELGAPSPVDAPLAPTLRSSFDRLASGDSAALEEIYGLLSRELYGLALWRTGNASEAEDAVQEVFVRLADPNLDLRRVRDPRAYLLTMARRAAVDRLRSRPRGESLEDRVADFLAAPEEDPSLVVDAAAASKWLKRLGEAQREVLFLREYAGLSFRRIGAVTGVSTFTAASRHRLAIRKLRKWMGVEK
ncbi:MAG: sigma-70 family RNA polymerase sigma factor [Deltaproteobacteria bacterium]|nr:sigma-70 family RNA polymerase sigma factor [Deltaproteobacteria bacterium]